MFPPSIPSHRSNREWPESLLNPSVLGCWKQMLWSCKLRGYQVAEVPTRRCRHSRQQVLLSGEGSCLGGEEVGGHALDVAAAAVDDEGGAVWDNVLWLQLPILIRPHLATDCTVGDPCSFWSAVQILP